MALYGYNLSFKVLLRVGGWVVGWVGGWVGGRVPDFNATSGPQLTAEADFSSVKLVSWGQVWQYSLILVRHPDLRKKEVLNTLKIWSTAEHRVI